MALSLLQICQEAIGGIGGLEVPTTIFNNDGDDATVLKYAALQVGRELVRDYSWQALLTPTTISTVDTVSRYDLPSDFKRFANDTFYNVTEAMSLLGPLTPAPWAVITRGTTISAVNYTFRVRGNTIELTPTPSEVQTIGYDYYADSYCTSSGGTAQSAWLSDGDLARLPDDLFVLGVRYRYLLRKELPHAEDKADYLNALQQAVFDDTPKAVADTTGRGRVRASNIPDGNFGL